MFYNGYLRGCENLCKRAIYYYDDAITVFNKEANRLNDVKYQGYSLLGDVENIINSIANTPKNIQVQIQNVNSNLKNYRGLLEEFDNYNQKMLKTDKTTSGTAAIIAGAGMAAPSGLLAVATTFGTASTGTAIATLHGAAASNAALAWIGGGALSAGGGGMAVGNAVLAACGPVGWVAAATVFFGGVGYKFWKNKKQGDRIRVTANNISNRTYQIKKDCVKVENKAIEMEHYMVDFLKIVRTASRYKGSKYMDLSEEDQNKLVNLVNEAVICSEYVKWGIKA